jgi:hypothetical protein
MHNKIDSLLLMALAMAIQCSCGRSDSGKLSPAALEQIRNSSEISIVVEVEPKGLYPFKAFVQKVLERVFSGLGIGIAKGPAAFPVFLVRISADAVGKSYWVENGGYETKSYSGARVKGEMVLAQANNDKLKKSFSGSINTAKDILYAIEDPFDAPFNEALQQSDFLPVIADLIDSCWGREKVLAVMTGIYDEALPWRDWRLAALRSLESFGDAKATEALRKILIRHVDALADPSADIAFDDCMAKLLDILVARNDRDSRPAVVRFMGKLLTYSHHGAWGDSGSYLQSVASRLN